MMLGESGIMVELDSVRTDTGDIADSPTDMMEEVVMIGGGREVEGMTRLGRAFFSPLPLDFRPPLLLPPPTLLLLLAVGRRWLKTRKISKSISFDNVPQIS